MRTVHVVGAGLAGLAAAVHLARAGAAVRLYELSPRAGGRCRSYFDAQLGCTIDNGNHLILGANDATYAYLDTIGSRREMHEIAPASIPFLDLKTGETWSVRPNAGPLPWWIFAAGRRPPGTRPLDYLGLARLIAAPADATVGQYFDPAHPLYTRLVEPLATAILNTAPEQAAARPLAGVLRATLLRGERACRPAIARASLSKALVEPALAYLQQHGATFRGNARLDALRFAGDAVAALVFADAEIALGPDNAVVLATPAWVTGALMPGTVHPVEHRAIVNAHFRLPEKPRLQSGPVLGLVSGTAQWLIARGDIVSVTVSAADRLTDLEPERLLELLWRDVAIALRRKGPPPPARLIKEKRATFAQTPAAERLRPQARTAWRNLSLAGDWIATGLPATIEGAIRSGVAAARIAATQC